jgi:hypothetical protein
MVMKIFEQRRRRMVFMAPESYHGRNREVRAAGIWLASKLENAVASSSDDTIVKGAAAEHSCIPLHR